MKKVIIFATIHQHQMLGGGQNAEVEKRLDYLGSKFGAQIVMEEWAEKLGQSVGARFAARSGIPWANVGTPDEPHYQTYTGPINFPGNDGSQQPPDWNAPGMDEYGPFKNQEARENRMVQNVQAEMQSYETGLFIFGLAHMHSLCGKLLSLGLKVTGYSWL